VSEAAGVALVLIGRERGMATALVGVVLAARTLPQVATGPFVGSLLDRTPRPELAVAIAAAIAGGSAALCVVGIGRWPLGVVVALVAGEALCEPALTGGLSGLATRGDAVTSVTSWDAVAYNVAGVGAPAVITVAVRAGGSGAATATIVVLAAIGAVLLPGAGLRAAPASTSPGGARRAWAAILHHRGLLSVTVATTCSTAAFGGLSIAAVALAEQRHHPSDDGGILVTVLAVGALVGSLVWTRVRPFTRPERSTVVIIALVGGAFAVTLAPHWCAALAGYFVAGVLDGPLLIATFTARSRYSDDDQRAAVYTIGASLKTAATAAGAILVGAAVRSRPSTAGIVTIVAIQAVAALVGAAILLVVSSARAASRTD
jgi:predicted MFS family arabinose efflux permease